MARQLDLVYAASLSRAILAAALSVTNGCRHFEPAPLAPAESAAALESRSLADPGLHSLLEKVLPGGTPVWPLAKWDLTSLTLAALYFHPSLDVARAHWQVAEAGVRTAGARPNPTLSVTPQFVANAAAGATPWDITSLLDWPIETAGKRRHRTEQAEALTSAAQRALLTAAWGIRRELRGAVAEAVAAERRAALLVRRSDAEGRLVELLDRRVAAGAASHADVSPQRLAHLATRSALAAAEPARAAARAAVAAAVGLPASALDGVALADPLGAADALDDLSEADARRRALLERADVLGALDAYAASEAALRLELAKQWPDLQLGPNYMFDQGQNEWGLAVSIELPLLNRNEGPIAEAVAARSASAASFDALQLQVIGDLDQAFAARAGARAQVEQLRAAVGEPRAAADRARAARTAGAADETAVAGAEVELLRGEGDLLDAELALEKARAQLEAVVQGPLAAPETLETPPRPRLVEAGP